MPIKCYGVKWHLRSWETLHAVSNCGILGQTFWTKTVIQLHATNKSALVQIVE